MNKLAPCGKDKGGGSSVAVVITTYNHARFLESALESVASQSRAAAEVIVVDDGSADNPAGVMAAYPAVRLIRQGNQGLAAARNTGLRAAGTEFILFLDADDRLLPSAIAAGLACFGMSPGCAFVYGAHRRVDADGAALGGVRYSPATGYAGLLRGNTVAMHAAVLYRRDALLQAGGFDPALRRCEDYELYLRLARDGCFASHPGLVAEYRWHGSNMSADHGAMLQTVLAVHARHRAGAAAQPGTRRAWREGRRNWIGHYAAEAHGAARSGAGAGLSRLGAFRAAARLSPGWAVQRVAQAGWRRVRSRLPWRLARALSRGRMAPPVGRVRFGDLDRTTPISSDFGFDRGLPVDRYYIEGFLARHASGIAGRVLEVGSDEYSRRFGHGRIAQQDVLHVHGGNPHATIIGDLGTPGVLTPMAFDCIVLTQTLHLIYDMPAALAQLHAALKPGGVLLLTVPGISQIDRGEWGERWFWSLTPAALRRLLGGPFGESRTVVEAHGNVLAAMAFLQGLACTEVDASKLDIHDEAYPVVVTARAVRAA